MSVRGLQGCALLAAPTGCFSASFCQAAPSCLPWVLEALAAAPDVLLDSAPLGFCIRTGPQGGTVTSAPTVPVGKVCDGTLAGFPRDAEAWEWTGMCRSSSCSAPTSVGGVEAGRALRML